MVRNSIVMVVMLIVVAGCDYSQPLTVAEVNRDQESLIGKTIVVQGTVSMSGPSCLEAICDIPCCIACWGNLILPSETNDFWLYLSDDNGLMGCSGSECEIICEPFKPGDKVILTGTLKDCYGFSCTLEMDTFDYSNLD